MTNEALNPSYDWFVELCDHHSLRFRCNYAAFLTIQEALRSKAKCIKCKLDIPESIEMVNIRKIIY